MKYVASAACSLMAPVPHAHILASRVHWLLESVNIRSTATALTSGFRLKMQEIYVLCVDSPIKLVRPLVIVLGRSEDGARALLVRSPR